MFTLQDVANVCNLLMPVDSVLWEIKSVVLQFSGHLYVGERSMSWYLY